MSDASHFAGPLLEWVIFERLLHPLALLVLPMLLLPLIWSWWGAQPSLRYSSIVPLADLPVTLRQRLRWIPNAFRILACVALAVALARPQTGYGEQRIEGEGVAMMLVVDRSRSMEAPMRYEGRVMSRLDVVKDIIRLFVLGDGEDFDGRPADPIGLISFAGYAETLAPVVRSTDTVVDLASQIQFVDERLNRQLDGTAIGEGIALAVTRLGEIEQRIDANGDDRPAPLQEDGLAIRSKVIILLTDGEENRGEIGSAEAAQMARELDIKIYTIAIGDPNDRPRGFLIPRANPFAMLERIADFTSGKFFLATDGDALRDIYMEIDRLEKSNIQSIEYTRWQERFAPYALIGLALLVLEVFLASTIFRRSP